MIKRPSLIREDELAAAKRVMEEGISFEQASSYQVD